ncbi:uncharacterized protein BO95DRAFT_203906 [Aspergillus brunneoviolaceus CBS 621.78]|uniref:Uncharacterized protein n=1 Tax=Aspergillus brunneoviolaceus CBS 621.78 TaxID=1450534 RepID=A0ACD1G3K2_9EURO|nr:hypothetical protein BO95DRAFT_203906 [Aspergillus brunneoviolaceus CBS 621.78]RAH43762.1 hypothetical protein BO95DRAFT_203906 [Aspergillus brunneoviolaceus CBS 621.78]
MVMPPSPTTLFLFSIRSGLWCCFRSYLHRIGVVQRGALLYSMGGIFYMSRVTSFQSCVEVENCNGIGKSGD